MSNSDKLTYTIFFTGYTPLRKIGEKTDLINLLELKNPSFKVINLYSFLNKHRCPLFKARSDVGRMNHITGLRYEEVCDITNKLFSLLETKFAEESEVEADDLIIVSILAKLEEFKLNLSIEMKKIDNLSPDNYKPKNITNEEMVRDLTFFINKSYEYIYP